VSRRRRTSLPPGERAGQAGTSDITEVEVLAAEPRLRSRVDVGLYDRATPTEQRYLHSMARVWRRQTAVPGNQ
jgi:hypothetical protein